MLSKIKITLRLERPVNMSVNMSSVMHGVLMELVGRETAEYLHTESLRSYSQHLEIADDEMIWNVCSLTEFAYEKSDRYVKLRFLTPTAFKQNGKYTFYPDLSCIYGSLMRRMDFVSLRNGMYDEDLLEELTKRSDIVSYNLRTVNYHLEGVRIPAFIGRITIKITGAQSLINYVNMLMKFGEFSGLGIKTSLGMGAVKIIEASDKKNSGLMENKEKN